MLLFAVCLMASLTVNAQTFYENGIMYEMTNSNWNEAIVVSSYYDDYQGDIVIPETVSTEIWSNYEYYDLTVTIVGIGEEAFRGCDQLTSVSLPNSIKTIGRNAFYGCSALQDVTLPSSLTTIDASAFGYCTSLSTVIIPSGVTSIGWNAFYCCTGLTSVSILSSVTQLNGTFFGCTGLTSIELPQSLITLDGTFTGCTGLTSIVVPASVGYIGSRTFDGCTALTSVVLPSSLTYMAEQAFFNCENLKTVTCLAATPPAMYTYNSECFTYSTYMDGKLFVPGASIERYQSSDWWSLFQQVQGLMSLNETSLTLEKGRTFALAATFAPGFNPTTPINWRSSNPAVATVSVDGIIRAIALGEAFIYASVENEEVSCQVIVIAGQAIPGDVDGDGEVGIADVAALIDIILSDTGDPALHDVDGDGEVGIADVALLIDMILRG